MGERVWASGPGLKKCITNLSIAFVRPATVSADMQRPHNAKYVALDLPAGISCGALCPLPLQEPLVLPVTLVSVQPTLEHLHRRVKCSLSRGTQQDRTGRNSPGFRPRNTACRLFGRSHRDLLAGDGCLLCTSISLQLL
jgi:hypothetical protein